MRVISLFTSTALASMLSFYPIISHAAPHLQNMEKYTQTPEQIDEGTLVYQQALQYVYGLDNTSIDITKAVVLFERARKLGNTNAIARLADLQVGKDNKTAYVLASEAANKGSGVGNLILGEMYYHGWYVAKDEKLAAQYFLRAFDILQAEVKEGKLYHLNTLAYMYDYGYGTTQDIDKAKTLYRQASDLGNMVSKRNLAELYKTEELTEEQRKEMLHLFLQAAERNEVESQYEIGEYYIEHGQFEDGIFWLKKAAKQGLSKARLLIANLSLTGLGMPIDIKFALSELEVLEDYYTLASLYERGTGVPRDLAKALHYYELLNEKKQGDELLKEEILEKITKLKRKLSKKNLHKQ